MDERHWLMGTAYNTGIECLQLVVLRYRFVLLTLLSSVSRYWTTQRGGLNQRQQSVGSYRMVMRVRRRQVDARLIAAVNLTGPAACRSPIHMHNF